MKEKYSTKDHTFVICAYGESPYLEECIRSLKKQTQKSGVLLATSTSNNYIQRLSEKYNVEMRVRQEKSSLAGDWNFAYCQAKSRLVTLAHQDDVYGKDYTEKILKAVNWCKRPLIVFSDYSELKGEKVIADNRLMRVKRLMLFPLRFRFLWKSKFVRRRILSFGNPICCPSVTMVKSAFSELPFQDNMESNIDWQTWEIVSKEKGEFAYVSEILMQHRIHEQSTTTKILAEKKRKAEDLFMYKKFWPDWFAIILEKLYQKSERLNDWK